MMRSSRGSSSVVVAPAVPSGVGAAAAPGSLGVLSAMVSSDLSGRGRGDGGLEGLLVVGVLDDLLEQGVELVVAVELGEQVHQALAGVEQLAQGLDLLDHL